MLHVVYDTRTGAPQRVSTFALFQSNEHDALVSFSEFDAEPDPEAYVWNPVTHQYDARPGSPAYTFARTKLSKREFLNRLGSAVLGAVNARIVTPPVTTGDIQVIAGLLTAKDFLNAVTLVDLEHPDTINYVALLVSLGYLDATQQAAVLAPSTVREE
jgi:hypothetical protein